MRNHIKIQQQLKLYIEGQQDKIDEANCLVKEKERNMQTNDKKIQDLIQSLQKVKNDQEKAEQNHLIQIKKSDS